MAKTVSNILKLSTAAEPAKIQIEFSESETISIEEVQVDPKSNQRATILPYKL